MNLRRFSLYGLIAVLALALFFTAAPQILPGVAAEETENENADAETPAEDAEENSEEAPEAEAPAEEQPAEEAPAEEVKEEEAQPVAEDKAEASEEEVPQVNAVAELKDGEIMVTAQGLVRIQPEFATLRLAVVAQAPTAAEANNANNASMEAVFALLKEKGISEEDYYTSSYSIWPQTNWDQEEPQVYAYQVENEITIKVRDIAQLGEIIAASLDAGANRVNNISYDVESTHEAYNQALKLAVERGQEKAQVLADAIGVELIPVPARVIEGSEPSYGFMNYADQAKAPMEAAEGMNAGAPPLSQQDVQVNASVQLVFKFK